MAQQQTKQRRRQAGATTTLPAFAAGALAAARQLDRLKCDLRALAALNLQVGESLEDHERERVRLRQFANDLQDMSGEVVLMFADSMIRDTHVREVPGAD